MERSGRQSCPRPFSPRLIQELASGSHPRSRQLTLTEAKRAPAAPHRGRSGAQMGSRDPTLRAGKETNAHTVQPPGQTSRDRGGLCASNVRKAMQRKKAGPTPCSLQQTYSPACTTGQTFKPNLMRWLALIMLIRHDVLMLDL